jgi:hypothetical protein
MQKFVVREYVQPFFVQPTLEVVANSGQQIGNLLGLDMWLTRGSAVVFTELNGHTVSKITPEDPFQLSITDGVDGSIQRIITIEQL